MQKDREEMERKRGRGGERESEGKFFSGLYWCIQEPNCLSSHAWPYKPKKYSYYRAEKLQIFLPQKFLSQENKIKYV